jgi:hypothetical protein
MTPHSTPEAISVAGWMIGHRSVSAHRSPVGQAAPEPPNWRVTLVGAELYRRVLEEGQEDGAASHD